MLYFRSLVCWLLVAVCAATANARPGDFDLAFGTDGKTITSLARYSGGFDSGQAAIVQGDGRILVAEICEDGSRYRTCIARFDSTGNIDTAFGQNGVARLDMQYLNLSMPVRLIPDGAGTIVATACPDREGSCLFRLTASGTLDSAFGTNGTALSMTHRQIHALAWQGSALLAAGRCMTSASFASALCVWRYLPNGTPDTGFGNQGELVSAMPIVQFDRFETDLVMVGQTMVVGTACLIDTMTPPVLCVTRLGATGATDMDFGVTGLARVAVLDGYHRFSQLVVTGQSIYAVGTCAAAAAPQSDRLCLVRLDTGGAPDPSYGFGGKVSTSVFGANSNSRAVGAFMSPVGLIVGGYCQAAGIDRICATRYNAAGEIDSAYGDLGTATSAVPQIPRIAVSGADFSVLFAGQCNLATDANLCLARITPGGMPDAAFGVGGVRNVSLGTIIANERPSLIAAAASGKFLTAGDCFAPAGTSVPCVARYMSDGNLDLTLASAGFFLPPAGTIATRIEGIADDNGKTLVVMPCAPPASGTGIPCAYRFLDSGMLDASYGAGGFVEIGGVSAGTKTMMQGGKLIVAGNCIGTTNSICVTRLNVDGTLDASYGVNGPVTIHGANKERTRDGNLARWHRQYCFIDLQ